MSEEQDKNQALDMLRAVNEDGVATINGRDYELTKLTHAKRRKVFAFYSAHAQQIESGNFGFMDSSEFAEIEKVISNVVIFDGDLLSRRQNHWDEYPEDYLMFITVMLGAISYPFLRGLAGG
jgi:hypothetical protein